jgi:hypothetical protein
LNSLGPDCVGPFDPTQVPFGERFRFGFDDEVFLESWVGSTDLRMVTIKEDPQLVGLLRLIGEVKTHHNATFRKKLALEVPGAPRVQHHPRVNMLLGEFDPAFPPGSECKHDPAQVLTCFGQAVQETAPFGVRSHLYHPGPFQLSETGSEECSRESWCPIGYFGEGVASEEEIAKDDRCPSLGEDFGGSGDRAVLTIGSHTESVALHGSPLLVHFLF